MSIKFYKTNDPYGFCSNFKKARMFFGNRWWDNVEAAYQAAKTVTREDEDSIWKCTSPREAREVGQKVQLRPDWDQVKYKVMHECCKAKFLQHSDLRHQLIASGDEELIEDSPVDYYWGCGKDGSGKNMLGKVLMEIRSELQGE